MGRPACVNSFVNVFFCKCVLLHGCQSLVYIFFGKVAQISIVITFFDGLQSINNSRTPAFGGISLALRGRGAFGAPVRAPVAPIWATAAFGGGKINKNWGATGGASA